MCVFFHKTLVLALKELLRLHQQNDEEKDLIESGICQVQFAIRQLAKGDKHYFLLGEEDGEGSL